MWREIQEFWHNNLFEILVAIGIFILSLIIARLIRVVVDKYFQRSSVLLKSDPTHYKFLKHFISAAIIVLGTISAIYVVPGLRSLALSIFAGAGILAAILGFASQQAFSNIISGIFLVVFKPYRVEDWIMVGERYRGYVEDITLRHTVIRDFENRRIIMPNAVISNETIINSTIDDEYICKHVEMGISYDSDIDLALQIMGDEARKHPFYIDNRTQQQIKEGESDIRLRVMGFGDSSVNLRAYVWATSPENAFIMEKDLYRSIKLRFDREGIEIPFPYRTLVFKNSADKFPTEPAKNPES